jgi:uncharacterized membrane protein
MLGWGVVVAVHLLAAVAWVGGMFSMMVVLRPSLAGLDELTRMDVTVRSLKRLFLVVWHAMPIMIITGYAMLFGVYGGFGEAPWPIHIMNLLGLIMSGIFLWVFFGPWKEFNAAPQMLLLQRIRNVVTINLALGVITICVGGLSSFASS